MYQNLIEYRYIKILLVIFAILSVLICTGCGSNKKQESIKSVNGQIDVTNWNYESDGQVELTGDWAYYDKLLLNPGDIQSHTPMKYMDVSEKTGYFASSGYGTYHAQIKIGNANQVFYFMHKYSSFEQYRVFIDGILIAENGIPKPSKLGGEPYQDVLLRTEKVFVAKSDTIDVIYQVASDKIPTFQPLIITTESQMVAKRDFKALELFLLIGFLISLSIYHIIIYLFRRSEKSNLALGISGVFAALAIILGYCRVGDTYLILEQAISNFVIQKQSMYAFLVLHNDSAYFAMAALAVTICYFNENKIRPIARKIFMITFVVMILFSVTTLVDSQRIGFYFYLLHLAGMATVLGVLCFEAVNGLRGGTFDSKMVFVGAIICTVTVVNDVLLYLGLKTNAISIYGCIFFLLTKACAVAFRFMQSFDSTERFSNELEQTLSKLGTMIKKSDDMSAVTDSSVQELARMICVLSVSSSQITDAIEVVSVGACTQTEKSKQGFDIANTLSEKTENLKISADNMKEIAMLLINSSKEGEKTIENLHTMQEENDENMQQVNNAVIDLTQKIKQINNFSKTILNISKEIKLLSLNASIEAAKSQNIGSGFSVIARDIQKLAVQTDKKAKEIQNEVDCVFVLADNAFNKLNNSNEVAKDQKKILIETVSVFDGFRNSIAESIDQINEMYNKVDEFMGIRMDLLQSIDDMSKVAEVNSAVTQQVIASVEEQVSTISMIHSHTLALKEESEKMRELIISIK